MVRTIPVRPGDTGGLDWTRLVERALEEGIISIDQAERIRALAVGARRDDPVVHDDPVVVVDVAEPDQADQAVDPGASDEPVGTERDRRRARVAEALGYVGGVLVLVAGAITVGQFWDDLAPWAHATMLGALTALLLLVGSRVQGPASTFGRRLGGFLWFLAVGAAGATAGVVGDELLELEEAGLAVWTTAVATGVAGRLWWARRWALQAIAMVVGTVSLAVSLVGLADEFEAWGGLVTWGVGIAWMLLGRVLEPRRVVELTGAVPAVLGPILLGADNRWSLVLSVATSLVLVGLGVVRREVALLGLGVFGLFLGVPVLVFEFFGEQLGAPMALLVTGVVLLGIALWVARASTRGSGGPDPSTTRGAMT